MAKDIVKINSNDIKEMVVTCVDHLLKEDFNSYGSFNFYYRYRRCLLNGHTVCFFTDNLEFAKKRQPDQPTIDDCVIRSTNILQDHKIFNAGEVDLSDASEETISDYFNNQGYAGIEFYPDNKTTCIALSDEFYEFSSFRRTGNDVYYKNNVDFSRIEIIPYDTGESEISGFKFSNCTIMGYIDKLKFRLGEVRIHTYGYPTDDGNTKWYHKGCIGGYFRWILHMFDNHRVNHLLNLLDFEKKTCQITITILPCYQNIGIASIVLKKVLDETAGEDCHYLMAGSIGEFFEDDRSLAGENLAQKFGFELIYNDDRHCVYYKL